MPTQSWRDVIRIHAAADLFPLLEPDQLTELAGDIRKNGLLQPVTIYQDDDGSLVLVDGRNRLDAMQLLGWVKIRKGEVTIEGFSPGAWQSPDAEQAKADPYAYAVALNVRRRHLTGEQKRELVGKLIKADPTKSNRQIAAMADRSHPTVAKIRDELEAKGDVVKVSTSIDTKGRKQPARHAPAAPASDAEVAAMTDRLNAMLPASIRAAKPKPAALNLPKPPSSGMRLCDKQINEIARAIHTIAGDSLDLKPKDVLASIDSEGKRINLLGSARLAYRWLGELLEAAE